MKRTKMLRQNLQWSEELGEPGPQQLGIVDLHSEQLRHKNRVFNKEKLPTAKLPVASDNVNYLPQIQKI